MEPIGPQKTKSQIQANKKVEDEIEYDVLNPEEEDKNDERSSRGRKSTGGSSESFVVTKCDSTPESQNKGKKSVDAIFKERLQNLKKE